MFITRITRTSMSNITNEFFLKMNFEYDLQTKRKILKVQKTFKETLMEDKREGE